jgi:hypothetical protein
LCLNGHKGSAFSTFFPGVDGSKQAYWYGDAFARRGYVVLAVDMSHRPPPDRQGLYAGYEDGDDPRHGNGAQPAIKFGTDQVSEWAEAGERAWDILHAHDYLRSLPEVDSERVLVAGLSLGGEMAIFAGALDPRFAAVIAGGYPPDLAVRERRQNHACWQWQGANVREYIDLADLHALIAPRGLVVETSTVDRLYSDDLPVPLASAKQAARRIRAAYGGESSQFIHYLHDQRLYRHEFCVGDVNPENPGLVIGVEVPCLCEPGAGDGGQTAWQTDGTMHVPALGDYTRPTLFDYLDERLLPSGREAA